MSRRKKFRPRAKFRSGILHKGWSLRQNWGSRNWEHDYEFMFRTTLKRKTLRILFFKSELSAAIKQQNKWRKAYDRLYNTCSKVFKRFINRTHKKQL